MPSMAGTTYANLSAGYVQTTTVNKDRGSNPMESQTFPLIFPEMVIPNLTTARINGRIEKFDSVRETFDALVTEWRKKREPGSSTAPVVNDAYGQIVAMGWHVVPFLLEEVNKQSGHWFDALTWITRHDVESPEVRGNIRELRRRWLEWGFENGQRFWWYYF